MTPTLPTLFSDIEQPHYTENPNQGQLPLDFNGDPDILSFESNTACEMVHTRIGEVMSDETTEAVAAEETPKRRRGRPRPAATLARDEQIFALIAEAPRTRDQIIEAIAAQGEVVPASIVYLSLARLRTAHKVKAERGPVVEPAAPGMHGRFIWRPTTPEEQVEGAALAEARKELKAAKLAELAALAAIATPAETTEPAAEPALV